MALGATPGLGRVLWDRRREGTDLPEMELREDTDLFPPSGFLHPGASAQSRRLSAGQQMCVSYLLPRPRPAPTPVSPAPGKEGALDISTRSPFQ